MSNPLLNSATKQDTLARHFRSLISTGFLKPGDMLPPEIALAKEFGVSRITITRALAALVREGLLIRRRGHGTVVLAASTPPSSAGREQAAPSAMTPGGAPGASLQRNGLAVIASLRTEDPLYSLNPNTQMFLGIEDTLATLAAGQRIRFYNVFPHNSLTTAALDEIKKAHLCGVLHLASLTENNLCVVGSLQKLGIPFVVASASAERMPGVDMVSICQFSFGYLAAQHLIALGHKKMVYVIPTREFDWLEARIAGIRLALQEAGMQGEDCALLRHGEELTSGEANGFGAGREAAGILLRQHRNSTAVIAVNDAYAVGMIDELARRGVRVPADLSIVGADDEAACRGHNLTTIRQPFRELGIMAAEMLVRKLSGGVWRQRFEYIQPWLVERTTTQKNQR